MKSSKQKDLVAGVGFLAPNILGFLIFTCVPLVMSVILAFSNWDIRFHNMFKDTSIQFVGLRNFIRLFQDPDFYKFFGNTLFLMMGIPFTITGSLVAALLLSKTPARGHRQRWGWLIASSGLVAAVIVLTLVGAGASTLVIVIGGLFGMILFSGSIGGVTVYRTLFYMPHFTAGVATFILWKKLYNPETGPINHILRPILSELAVVVNGLPGGLISNLIWPGTVMMILLFLFGVTRFARWWRDGDVGWIGLLLGTTFICLPMAFSRKWMVLPAASLVFLVVGLVLLLVVLSRALFFKRVYTCPSDEGIGQAILLGLFLMILQFIFLGLGNVVFHLPEMAVDGLKPPSWLTTYNWAKPSIMLMGFWAAIGSNNMLLYLAGLTNVPQELYEAADIDGASRFQRFWNVTWPQLASITFFIGVMSTINGLRGGFEMARTMTEGGPAGATTTLSYFIYTEGFQTGRLGFATSVAWTLFALIFLMTIFNWKFGNRYAND